MTPQTKPKAICKSSSPVPMLPLLFLLTCALVVCVEMLLVLQAEPSVHDRCSGCNARLFVPESTEKGMCEMCREEEAIRARLAQRRSSVKLNTVCENCGKFKEDDEP